MIFNEDIACFWLHGTLSSTNVCIKKLDLKRKWQELVRKMWNLCYMKMLFNWGRESSIDQFLRRVERPAKSNVLWSWYVGIQGIYSSCTWLSKTSTSYPHTNKRLRLRDVEGSPCPLVIHRWHCKIECSWGEVVKPNQHEVQVKRGVDPNQVLTTKHQCGVHGLHRAMSLKSYLLKTRPKSGAVLSFDCSAGYYDAPWYPDIPWTAWGVSLAAAMQQSCYPPAEL